jgi:hypothetical protein
VSNVILRLKNGGLQIFEIQAIIMCLQILDTAFLQAIIMCLQILDTVFFLCTRQVAMLPAGGGFRVYQSDPQ